MRLDNFIPVIPSDDEFIHSITDPFCEDPKCPCHEDEGLIAIVAYMVDQGLLTPEEATRFVKGEML